MVLESVLVSFFYKWLTRKELEKEEMKNPRVSRRKEILKIRAEINKCKRNKRDHRKKSTKKKLIL